MFPLCWYLKTGVANPAVVEPSLKSMFLARVFDNIDYRGLVVTRGKLPKHVADKNVIGGLRAAISGELCQCGDEPDGAT